MDIIERNYMLITAGNLRDKFLQLLSILKKDL